MFGAHGEFQICSKPPLMYLELKGSFNNEGITLLTNGVVQELSTHPENTIKFVVVNLREFELLTLDGLDSLETYFAGVKERGYQRVDYININIIAKNMFEKVWKNSDVEVNFYKDTDSYLLVHPNDSYIKQNW
ncbi:hypothetical protein EU510_16355 [Pseudoalteromonas sp. FUC4]|uniref:hypothetical protein n=1 Tax=Pseudoalteromonas sp. FUC4 TaxID=2511201 RepID=UPI0011F11B19|nr:hypothetical protein [Pseudoalteromonas sp. FUC4]KAA1150657.1 hypothetical protein EU510_16355 [Pseudoalteromonas sp. FUC4]